MSLHDIILDRISEQDFLNLISMAIPESAAIDYKRDTYGNSGGDKREFLSDMSSFANTIGGDLVIGIDEAGGLPIAITPFTGDADAEVRRLESIAIPGVEPRLTNLRVRPVSVSGGHVVVVRVPRSFNPPHRVIAQGSNRFWARAGANKYEPDVEQLRRLFTDVPSMLERIRAFRADRLVKIAGGETPISMGSSGKVVLHVVPLPAFVDVRLTDIISEMRKGTHVPLPLDDLHVPYRDSVNLDGFLNQAIAVPGARTSYAQFFRTGAIEGVGELQTDDNVNSRFITRNLTNLVVSRLRLYLDVMKAYDLGLPVCVFLSFCNATRVVHRYADPAGMGWHETAPLGHEIVALPEIFVDDFSVDVIDAMRPAFNTLWNAVGFLGCDRYDDLPKWRTSNPYALSWRRRVLSDNIGGRAAMTAFILPQNLGGCDLLFDALT